MLERKSDFARLAFSARLGSLQLYIVFLQGALKALAFGDVARRGEYALQFPVAIVEGVAL